MPQDNKSQSKTPATQGGATWTNNEIITLKQLASQNAPVSAISTKLHKTEDVIRAKAKELKLAVTSW